MAETVSDQEEEMARFAETNRAPVIRRHNRLRVIAEEARIASRTLGILTTAQKNRALVAMAERLRENAAAIKTANAMDMAGGEENGLSSAMLDRLLLDDKRIDAMADGVRQVAALPDPVGEISDERTRPNGLQISRKRVPIGVIGIIYESRPNVTADTAALCLKSGTRLFCVVAPKRSTPTGPSPTFCAAPSSPKGCPKTPSNSCRPPTGKRCSNCSGRKKIST